MRRSSDLLVCSHVCVCVHTCVRECELYYMALKSGFTEAPSVAAVQHLNHTNTRQPVCTRTLCQTTCGSQGQRRSGMCVFMYLCPSPQPKLELVWLKTSGQTFKYYWCAHDFVTNWVPLSFLKQQIWNRGMQRFILEAINDFNKLTTVYLLKCRIKCLHHLHNIYALCAHRETKQWLQTWLRHWHGALIYWIDGGIIISAKQRTTVRPSALPPQHTQTCNPQALFPLSHWSKSPFRPVAKTVN